MCDAPYAILSKSVQRQTRNYRPPRHVVGACSAKRAYMVNVLTANTCEGSPILLKGSVLTEIKNTSVIDFQDISDEEMNKMIDGTPDRLRRGDLIDGTVAKIEHDEVLVTSDSERGVIPARELSIRKDADPSEVVSLGDKLEALVLRWRTRMVVHPLQEAC